MKTWKLQVQPFPRINTTFVTIELSEVINR